jgi:hypothetical protein
LCILFYILQSGNNTFLVSFPISGNN